MEKQALDQLRHVLRNPNAYWSSDSQRFGVLGALDGSSDVLVISATGSGKTMIAIIAALLNPAEITVMVIPLRQLQNDYRLRLESMGVPFFNYTSAENQIPSSTSLLLVSWDMAVSPQFRSALRVVHETQKVGRFVCDEVHLPILDSDFRASLRYSSELRCVPAPIVGMTATGPPPSISIIADRLGLLHKFTLVRGPTDRPELVYCIEPIYKWADLVQRVVELVTTSTSILTEPEDRILIFVRLVKHGEELAQELGCELYTGKSAITPDRLQVYEDWTAGINKVLVGTSALIAGNDYRHIRMVIFAGTCPDTSSLIQGFGRAGRDGKPAYCHLLPDRSFSPFQPKDKGVDSVGFGLASRLAKNTTKLCIRFQLTRFSDGYGIFCKDSRHRHLCSNCEYEKTNPKPAAATHTRAITSISLPIHEQLAVRTSPSIGAPRTFESAVGTADLQRTQRIAPAQHVVDALERGFSLFQEKCTACDNDWHEIEECNRNQAKMIQRGVRYSKPTGQQKDTYGSVCYHCHLPQLPGDIIHPEFGKKEDCQHPHFMLGIAVKVKRDPELYANAKRDLKINATSYEEWLSQRCIQDPTFITNFVHLSVWYLTQIP
ncbi:hypothetical protein D9757_015535 [Collybiopsis confluens]|uniref:DNA 3'-5' helicase n=1 Tax=Collybiopsis confluens TaxID=2823264 RepID=A0A8H5C6Y2_9AGAR|nr:hypothetical protein D9757_015535 [Collybiopsis confluens]